MHETFLPSSPYHLGMTLNSGQAFRWREVAGGWESTLANRWVRLEQRPDGILVQEFELPSVADRVAHYLQTSVNLDLILSSFPADEAMQNARRHCHGLRLLRQEPWECLASFILSSTKQIVQIRQIVELLCTRFGTQPKVPGGRPAAFSFPSAQAIAARSEAELRACKMGFRAPYLLETARVIAAGSLNLEAVHGLPLEESRSALTSLPGVGRKIADCVLLFAYGRQEAFPVDVWVMKALRELYFKRRQPSVKRLHTFTQTYFGPNAGYAQQYLFHYMRTSKD